MAQFAFALVALSLFWCGYAATAGTGSDSDADSPRMCGKSECGSSTCGALLYSYKQNWCCGDFYKQIPVQLRPGPRNTLGGANGKCHGKKNQNADWPNHECVVNGVITELEQAGADVTVDFTGLVNTTDSNGMPLKPITEAYHTKGMCPVNVHWHLGAEHRSAGEFDENGKGPGLAGTPSHLSNYTRRLAGYDPSSTRYGYACSKYDATDAKFITKYNWQHCVGMYVGETYEIHWPHSCLGECHTPDQYQTPFYDGVFCNYDPNTLTLTREIVAGCVGVQSQVFTIVNDESLYYPDLIRGMIVDGNYGKDITAYTGSTTGTSRDNTQCSSYGPITWQVDRKCHLISASSFDKMCADMRQMRDDMSSDLYAHGARMLVAHHLTANNQVFEGVKR